RADRAGRQEAVPMDSDAAVPIGMVPEGDLEAEVHPAEIATGREWSERTIPPIWWMDRSDCRGDVQWEERGADPARASRHHRPQARPGFQIPPRRPVCGHLLDLEP